MENSVPLVSSNEISPFPRKGSSYSHTAFSEPGNPTESNYFLFMLGDGTGFVRDIDGTVTNIVWPATPETSYEIQATVISSSISGDDSQIITTNGWVPILSSPNTEVCGVVQNYLGTEFGSVLATFQISIRVLGTTIPVIVSTMQLAAHTSSNQ